MGILGIGYMLSWAAGLGVGLAALYVGKRWLVLTAILLAAGWPAVRNSVAIRKHSPFEQRKKPGTQRVVQWNGKGPGGIDPGNQYLVGQRGEAVAFLAKLDADIICLPDFNETIHPAIRSNIALFRDSLGYKHWLFDRYYYQHDWGADINTGLAIFSKWPVVRHGSVKYSGRKYPESILWADVQTPGGQLRVVATHLQSTHLGRDAADTLPIPYYMDADTAIIRTGTTLQKLRHYQRYHAEQAKLLRAFLDTCPSASVLAADLNSVPASWVYHRIRGGWNDVFLQLGSGVGATYPSSVPWLRIDYLLTNKGVQAIQFGQYRLPISDHDLLVADVQVGFPAPVE